MRSILHEYAEVHTGSVLLIPPEVNFTTRLSYSGKNDMGFTYPVNIGDFLHETNHQIDPFWFDNNILKTVKKFARMQDFITYLSTYTILMDRFLTSVSTIPFTKENMPQISYWIGSFKPEEAQVNFDSCANFLGLPVKGSVNKIFDFEGVRTSYVDYVTHHLFQKLFHDPSDPIFNRSEAQYILRLAVNDVSHAVFNDIYIYRALLNSPEDGNLFDDQHVYMSGLVQAARMNMTALNPTKLNLDTAIRQFIR